MTSHYNEFYIIEHFEDFCRCCLKNNKGKVNKHMQLSENTILALEFQETFGIDIADSKSLPANVCTDCFKMLTKIFKFRKTCLSTHERLTAMKPTLEFASEDFIVPIVVDVIEQFEKDDILVPVCENIKIESRNYAVQATECNPTNNANEDVFKAMKDSLDKKLKYERKSIQCPKCGTFVRNLKEHMRVHQSDPYICHICDKRITMKINMKQHLKMHFNIKDHKCSKCPKAFSSTSALKNHFSVHSEIRNFQCNLCDKLFKSSNVLTQHKKIVHYKHAKYTCELCETEKRFYTMTHFETHKRTVHAERLQCDICSVFLKNEKSFATHKLTHGIKLGQPEYVCNICGKVCTRGNALMQHKRCHNRPDGRGHKNAMKMSNKHTCE